MELFDKLSFFLRFNEGALAPNGVVTVRDEYLLFVKVSLMIPKRVMLAFADVTHSLAVAGAVLNTNLVCSLSVQQVAGLCFLRSY